MKKIRMGLVALGVAASVSLTACGTSSEDLGKEACDLYKDFVKAAESGDEDKIKDAQKKIDDFDEDHDDLDKDEEKEAEKAFEKECKDVAPPQIEIPE